MADKVPTGSEKEAGIASGKGASSGQSSTAASAGIVELASQGGDLPITKGIEGAVFVVPEEPLEAGVVQVVVPNLCLVGTLCPIPGGSSKLIEKSWRAALVQDHNMNFVDIYGEVDGIMILDDLTSRLNSFSIPMSVKDGDLVNDERLLVVSYLWWSVEICWWMGRSVKMKFDHNHILNDASIESSGLKGVETTFSAPELG